MPKTMPAIAILLPRRAISTETSSSSASAGNFPPPGFSTEQAKKPLPKDEQQKPHEKAAIPDVTIPKDEPTSSPKTKAHEARSLSELAAEKVAAETKEEKKALAKKEEKVKLTVWQKVKKEAAHYWDGTKLLVAEVKISSKLALKMAAGYELTRREHRQVQNLRTIVQSRWLTWLS
jgi:LETM1 and EF-hand domain-containing protein 1